MGLRGLVGGLVWGSAALEELGSLVCVVSILGVGDGLSLRASLRRLRRVRVSSREQVLVSVLGGLGEGMTEEMGSGASLLAREMGVEIGV